MRGCRLAANVQLAVTRCIRGGTRGSGIRWPHRPMVAKAFVRVFLRAAAAAVCQPRDYRSANL